MLKKFLNPPKKKPKCQTLPIALKETATPIEVSQAGGETRVMSTAAVPASAGEAVRMLHCGLGMVQSAAGFLAAIGAADLPAETLSEGLRALESTDAVGAAVRGRFLEAFDAQDGPVADGQRTARTWLVHSTRVTKRQAAEHRAVQALARQHPVLLAALAEGHVLTKSVALQLAKWTRPIPA